MKLKVSYEEYDRLGGSNGAVIIKGNSLRSCLLQILDTLGLYEEPGDVIYDEVNEIGHRLSDKKLLERIIEQSGDGSDYIYSIINLDTGETLYESDDEPEAYEIDSEWDNEPTYKEEIKEYGED